MKYPLSWYHWYTTDTGKSEVYTTGDKVTAQQVVKELKAKGFKRVSTRLSQRKGFERGYVITATY